MNEICSTCGLPKDLCVCESIAKEQQMIKVYVIKKKFSKVYTVVEGIDPKQIDIKDLTKRLKSTFACGGTYKDGKIELQGNHKHLVRDALVKLEFAPETIEVQSGQGY